MYQRAVVREFGEASNVVKLESAELPPLARDCIRIKMLARSINPSDLITISGTYRSRTSLPFVPGFEGAGIVEALGADVGQLRKGNRVVPIGGAGTWQEVKDTNADWCLKVPDGITNEQAAMSYINPMTAWVMLHEVVKIRPGMRIAITAAGSAIGRMMISMANTVGLVPVAFVRSKRSAARLSEMPVTLIHTETEAEYLDAIEKFSSDAAVDAIFDSVGGHAAMALANMLRTNGQFVHYGLLSGEAIPPAFLSLRPDIRFTMFHLRSWVREAPLDQVHQTYAHIASLICEGTIESKVRSRYGLDDLRNALIDAKNFSSRGKVIISS